MIRVWVPGDPVGKGRPRFNVRTPTRPGGRHTVRTYTPDGTRAWEARAALAARKAAPSGPLPGAVAVRVLVLVKAPARPASAARRLVEVRRKPDADNVTKAAIDALQGEAFVDDALVGVVEVVKLYTAHGEPAGVLVEVRELRLELDLEPLLAWALSAVTG